MGAPQAVTVFNTQTGAVLQTSDPFGNKSGTSTGITYTPDGLYLLFSQDGGTGSYVAIASVDPTTGLLSDYAHISVPMAVNAGGYLTTVTCFANSPPGTTGSAEIPCGQTVSLTGDGTPTSYPMGIAISSDGKTAYVVLDNNDTLTKIDLTQASPKEGTEIRVGNVPHSVVISPDGTTAYVSNEAGRIANGERLPGILQRHPGRSQVSDRLHRHRHHFRGRTCPPSRSPATSRSVCTRPAWLFRASTCWSPIPIATASR